MAFHNPIVFSPCEYWTLVTLDINNAVRYDKAVIKTFADAATEKAFKSGRSRNVPIAPLKRKFAVLDNATILGDLAKVPGNHFEKYKDHRTGQYSIRVNDKYRLFFRWQDGNAFDVRLADEH